LNVPSGSVVAEIDRAGHETVSVKFCVASGGTPLVAENWMPEKVPVWVGVPLSTPVAGENVTPLGRAPVL
jgi:hypothetical protein